MNIIADNGPREKSSAPSKIPKRNQTQGTGIKMLTPNGENMPHLQLRSSISSF